MNMIQRFFIGRNGSDQLNIALLVLAIIVSIIDRFVNSIVLMPIALLFLAVTLFRMFSKKIQARQKENAFFLRFWNKAKGWVLRQIRIFKEKKTHRFYKCPSCHNTLRVPKGKGKIYVTCPKCGERFTKKT